METVEAATLEDFYEASGTIRPTTSTVLSSRIMGTVISIRVREGDRVSAGQVVAEIDNREGATQLEKANAGLRQIEAAAAEIEQSISAAQAEKAASDAGRRLAATTLARYQTLLDRKSVSPQEFDEVQARFQVAEAEAERADKMLQALAARRKQAAAQIDQARSDISRAEIDAGNGRVVSPISGIVVSKQGEVGSIATPGAPLLTVEDTGRYRLEAAVEESRMASIKLKDAVHVSVDAAGLQNIDGRVGEILPASDPASRTYTVKIEILQADAQRRLRTGLYGTVRFLRGTRQALSVPADAVVHQGKLTGVYVVDETGVAHFRLVTTGIPANDRVEILSGLNSGESAAIGGISLLHDGSRVR